MSAPFFYSEAITADNRSFVLNEESSKHVSQVLRMKSGEPINLTNGKGYLFSAQLTDVSKKATAVNIINCTFQEPPAHKISIAISLIKNTSRFEWFIEKATEVGIYEIIPVICKRTEKQHFRAERMRSISVSAMLQSQQTWLPIIGEPIAYEALLTKSTINQKLIAHCEEDKLQSLTSLPYSAETLILIGPEGDFTSEEIKLALGHQFQPVSLGINRLRTETAGIVAAVLLANVIVKGG